MKEGDLMQVCKITSAVGRVNRESPCSLIFGIRSKGQMKLTGVTSEQKWLQMPWVVILCNFLLQNAAVTDILFEFKKGPDRLMEENIDLRAVMCKDETSASGSPKLDIAGSQGSIRRGKIEEIYLSLYYTNSNSHFSSEKGRSLESFLYLFCTTVLVFRLQISQDYIRKYCTQMNLLFFK